MCNIYDPIDGHLIARVFRVREPDRQYKLTLGPRNEGPFVISGGECRVGPWGLIPPFARERVPKGKDGKPLATNNARCETLATAPTFRNAWKAGRRCLIPAANWQEPYWGTGRNVWWRFWRSDGRPLGLAGLWDEWLDRDTGEVVSSYTMITQPAAAHPILSQMHRPGKEKRAVVPVEEQDWDTWLHGDAEQAYAMIRLPDHKILNNGPADPAFQMELPHA